MEENMVSIILLYVTFKASLKTITKPEKASYKSVLTQSSPFVLPKDI